MTPEVAAQLTRMMESVVEDGTGRRAQIEGVDVAGKTGTAQHGEGRKAHAWFISFAPADDPTIAVAVIAEDGGVAGSEAGGGTVAAPIARADDGSRAGPVTGTTSEPTTRSTRGVHDA